ncbi:UNVERIFIED_CONTAM: hypothetical protein Scaly_1011900 [Sesamum calycinum]|uniref:ATP-dependent DNA helicase n=1 Tax=Sesamum calycinum TaxID=2727403 RepID=A0AAW2QKD1_9LAMI
MAQSNSDTLPNKEYKRIQSNERRREAYNNKTAEEKNKLNARHRALYAQKSSIKKLHTLAASFSFPTRQAFHHVRDGRSCSLSSTNNTHESQTTRQVDAMDEESLHYPLFEDYHVTFGIPLDIQALEHRTSHDKDENQVNFDFGSEDINNSTPKVFGFGRLAKIGESPWCLPEAPVCMHCGAKRFHREPPGFCCSNGQVSLSTLNVPNELRDLFFGKGTNLQLYFHDIENEVDNRLAVFDKLKQELVLMIMKLLEVNPYSFFFHSLREIPELHDYKIILRADPGLDQRIYNVPTVDQVAAIWKDSDECEESQSRDIRVYPKSVAEKFSHKRETVSAREYYCYRLQMRAGDKSILLHSNRLLQQYVNDMYIKVETQRLDYFRHEQRQKNARIESLQGIVDSFGIHGENDPNKIGQRIILPASFIGGPRDMHKIWGTRKRGTVVGRIANASPVEGERYYLRILLQNIRGPTSFDSLKLYRIFERIHLSSVPMNLFDSDKFTKEYNHERKIEVSEADLLSIEKLNDDQRHAFNIITEKIYSSSSGTYFIDGPGGSGKTFLYRARLADVRSRGYIALAVATSGVAAALLPGGRTAHSRFKIPIDIDGKTKCKISKQTTLAKLLLSAKLIIWDEISMVRRQIIEALDDILQDLTDCDNPFGGKVVVFGDDYRQIAPVVVGGKKKIP